MKSFMCLRTLTIIALVAISFSSCVDKDYDEPTTANVDPSNLRATLTIRQLQLMANAAPTLVDSDIVVAGIITADDASGNFYKTIVLQDSTGGMDVQVDINNFDTDYPMGRRIFIKCKGLYIVNNGNLSIGVLGADNQVGRIPAALVPQYIYKGMFGLTVTPKIIHIDDINIPTNTLVTIQNVEFDGPGALYGVGSPPIRSIVDCQGNSLDLYSSSFASFALQRTPAGNGSITGIYTVYSGSGELQIRNLEDVQMNNLRCDGTNGQTTLIPIDSIRMLYTGTITAAPTGRRIKGTLISDYTTVMTNNRNAFIQDSTGGIEIHFSSAHLFALGTEIEVIISGDEISEYNGVLQLNGVSLANASATGSGSVTPRVTTIPDINANYSAWESTVVTINNVTITGTPTTFSGNKIVTDGTNTITLYTPFGATFAADSVPTTPVTITGILTEYNGLTELQIRNPSDIHP